VKDVEMATRTHTHFFGEEDLAAIKAEFDKLDLDWSSRSPHVPPELRDRGNDRVHNLRIAIDLLGEVAD
jgi:hypothetical protein